jgi:hypothetical protein
LNVPTSQANNVTTGRIYLSVIEKERRGEFWENRASSTEAAARKRNKPKTPTTLSVTVVCISINTQT